MITTTSLWDLVEQRAEATPDAEMAVDIDGNTLTFVGYRDAAERMAAGLADLGIGEDDVVSWELPTTNDALVLVAALARLGAVQNPIIPIYREREVGFIARQANPRLLMVPGELRGFDFEAMAAKIAADNEGMGVFVTEHGFPSGEPSTLGPPPRSEGVRWLFYTSGTTAEPKGAQHTDATVMAAARGMAECLELSPDDRNALVFPFTHIGGIIWLLCGLAIGHTQLVVPAFDPVTTIPFLRDREVTIAGAGTPFHMAYLAAQREQPDEPLFDKVRLFPGGGAPKPPHLHHEVKAELGGAGIVSGYGLTEAPILTMGTASDPDEALANSEGRPMDGVDIRVVTLEGEVAGSGEDGEIRAKAPQLMKGYLDAALDEEAFDDDGYFRTGDLGHLDRDGHIVITGRVKDVIIRKGENISAKEVEDLLFGHEAVADVAVIGLPDEASGERACAVVVTKDGASIRFEDMQGFLEGAGLRKQAIPEQLELVDSLPRNPAGKVLKQDLKERFA